ncbi:MAG: FAD binding domain-containing protein [Candidatus Methylomirabilales bacterium]
MRAGSPERGGEAAGGQVERFSPESLDEVGALLLAAETRAAARMRGGQLFVESEEPGRPRMVLDLGRLSELNRIEFDERLGLRLGAAVALQDLPGFPPMHAYPMLLDGLGALAHRPESPSLGELLGQAEVAGHVGCPLVCLAASTAVFGPHGWSEMGVEALLARGAVAALQPCEFLVDLRLPPPVPGSVGAYVSGRDGGEPGGAAVFLVMEQDCRTCCGARVAVWRGEQATARVLEVERFLAGKALDQAVVQEAAILTADATMVPPESLPAADAIQEALRRLPRA